MATTANPTVPRMAGVTHLFAVVLLAAFNGIIAAKAASSRRASYAFSLGDYQPVKQPDANSLRKTSSRRVRLAPVSSPHGTAAEQRRGAGADGGCAGSARVCDTVQKQVLPRDRMRNLWQWSIMKMKVVKLVLSLAALVSVLSASTPAGAQSSILQPSDLSGAWYDPAASGQGFMVDLSPNSDGTASAFGGWFTFTFEGALNEAYPIWFSFQGKVSFGELPAFVDIYYTEAGKFDSGPKVSPTKVGQGSLVFADCTHATFSYNVSASMLNTPRDSVSGSIQLVRLSSDAGCSQSSPAVKSSRGYSGTWYNPATSGQGLLFDVSDTGGGFFSAGGSRT